MTTVGVRAGVASDTGLQRIRNEDRAHADDARGMYVVIDGLGGHAAGEQAAEIALNVILRDLDTTASDIKDQIARAITQANNEIYLAARQNPEWTGMACVLTLAVVHDETVTVGHVGDSRLYLVWNGTLRKLTSDHSPVGELEDAGELTEAEAMNHPRRNEVFRDLGSQLRQPDDPDFLELKSFPLQPNAALVLCSDGLSDALSSTEIASVVETYNGDASQIAHRLVDAANARGGNDNISVVFVAGPDFIGAHSATIEQARSRHAITRMRDGRNWKRRLGRLVWLIVGIILGASIWPVADRIAHWTNSAGPPLAPVHTPAAKTPLESKH